MANRTKEASESKIDWKATQVFAMAAVCLAIGLLVGYLLRGSAPTTMATVQASVADVPPGHLAMSPAAAPTEAPPPKPTLEQMKHMADKQAEPLLLKLKADPNNAVLLNDAGKLYRATHQFKEAASYYQRSLKIDPKNVGARTDLASCLYYEGDVDGALAQLEKSLTYEPTHAGTLLNLGIMKFQGKHDAPGAIAAWEKLLRTNPNFAQKDAVKHMIAEARKQTKTS